MDDLTQKLSQLDRGMRGVVMAMLVFTGVIGMLPALSTDWFEGVFKDMLGDKPLPGATQLVIGARSFFLMTAALVPIAGVILLALVRNSQWALYGAAGAILISLVQSAFCFIALWLPLATITFGIGR
tara:strand:+ start:3853 stop:4233 length:381 start_codon:yes stop_codon:yes gene_type:complete